MKIKKKHEIYRQRKRKKKGHLEKKKKNDIRS